MAQRSNAERLHLSPLIIPRLDFAGQGFAPRDLPSGFSSLQFADSGEGRLGVASYPLIATAKLEDIDPQAWFADMLVRLPSYPASASRLGALEWSGERADQ